VKARIWFAPNDSIYGPIWVWHVQGVGPARPGWNWGHRTRWADALADCLAFMKEQPR
jgi:hypothetical protein